MTAVRSISFSASWRRALRLIGFVVVVLGLAFTAYVLLYFAPRIQSFGIDAYGYWHVDLSAPYALPHRATGAFPYSPPAAIFASTFALLPFWVFLWLWTALLVGSLIWLGGSAGWILVAFAIPFVALELYHGNIHVLIAVAVVLGFRHPWTWAFVVATKPTAAVGLLWFAVRREWHALGIVLLATAALCVGSLLVVPGLWIDWIDFLVEAPPGGTSPNEINVPLVIRLAVAAGLVTWGARTDRRWTVIVAVALSLPVLWFHGFAVLVGLLGEIEHRRATSASRALRWRRASPSRAAD